MNRFLFFLLLIGCSTYDNNADTREKILGRDDGKSLSRSPLYQVKVPKEWERRDPLESDSIHDTMKPLTTFYIQENGREVKITIHNFPVETSESKIPPRAQIMRWQKQFEKVFAGSESIMPHSTGGFTGLHFESSGIIQGVPVTMIGFAMQLAPNYYRRLQFDDELNEEEIKQTGADYTIKITGPPEMVANHHSRILSFANSFGLIRELPK